MNKPTLKNIPDFRDFLKQLYKEHKIVTWIVGGFLAVSAIVAFLANLQILFPPDTKKLEHSNLPQEVAAGYYTDWVYVGTETSRNLPSNDTLTKYEFRSVDTKTDGNTSYSVYTYNIYTRLYISP